MMSLQADRFALSAKSLLQNPTLPFASSSLRSRDCRRESRDSWAINSALRWDACCCRRQDSHDKQYIVKYLEKWAEKEIVPMLKPVDKCWQPQDFLPDAGMTGPDFEEQVRQLRGRAAGLPDDYLVCLVGDAITEEALPTYQTMLNSFVGSSSTPEAQSPWSTWVRGWTAEENRHGDLLNKYLYLTGRVDMRMVEKTIHHLISSGMDVGLERNPYYGFIYTAFQERATAISHGNTGRKAREAGDEVLARICGTIAADEKRHEQAYAKVVHKLLDVDVDGCMLALETMMRRKIVMPAHFMFDGKDANLFHHFSCVAQRVGVYTAADYALIMEHFVKRWKLESLRLSSAPALAAQHYVCSLPARYRKLEERSRSRAAAAAPPPPHHRPFSWIFNRKVAL